ncbi:MAG: high-affinity branched-chain amino acid ABC transporter permease LivM [Burkholderiaceae bacterium]|nr:MAG: high-affinity branched-chain amino acid ABC transporter permease LivM [Burkholderiaceae bacterium]TAM06154.1 MAG: high-affinity branched-chain amino acid ABC transporter permease LivM [Pusillimonas sp.]
MSPNHLKRASIAAVLAAIIIAPIYGLQIVRVNVQTQIKPDWFMIVGGALVVFIFQLTRPFINRMLGGWATHCTASCSRLALPHAIRRHSIWIIVLAAVALPFFADRAQIDVATLALIYIVLGLGLNIVVGFAGLLDLGYVGFYAVGAYSYALLYHWAGWGFWQALPVAGAAAALFGFVLGFPVLRLRGDYLAIVTLGFGEIIRMMLTNLQSLTNGPDGISGIPKPTVLGHPMTRRAADGYETFHQWVGWDFNTMHSMVYMYLLALAFALCTLFITTRLVRMPIGRAWEALREDEIACRSLGLNPALIKLSAFTLGALFAGIGGALFAARQGLVNPDSFTFAESALVLAIVVLGGMGSQAGVILAAILLTVLPEVARGLAEYRMLIFGLVMVLMMMWRPQGLLPAKRPQLRLGP